MTPQEALAKLADRDAPEPERVAAARELGQIATLAELRPMVSLLDRAEAGLGREIAAALRARSAADLFARELRTGTDEVRERAARTLQRIADPKAARAIAQALPAETSARVRRQLVEALDRITTDEATVALVKALTDENADVRCLAADALRRRGAKEAAPVLETALLAETDELARDYLDRAHKALAGA